MTDTTTDGLDRMPLEPRVVKALTDKMEAGHQLTPREAVALLVHMHPHYNGAPGDKRVATHEMWTEIWAQARNAVGVPPYAGPMPAVDPWEAQVRSALE